MRKAMSSKEVIVWVSLGSEDIRVGKLWFHVKGNKESASFEYDKKWLDHPERFALEPALKLTEGGFHTGQNLSLFGGFGDSAPDRWGRVLMRRFEAAKAKEQNRLPTTLFEIDYLLGVNDEARQGALRFSDLPDENIFLSPKKKISIPPLVDLP
jgi:serine/threonine-protein kinase HipA